MKESISVSIFGQKKKPQGHDYKHDNDFKLRLTDLLLGEWLEATEEAGRHMDMWLAAGRLASGLRGMEQRDKIKYCNGKI